MLIHDSRFSVDDASSAIDPGTGLATFNGYHFADSPEVTAFFERMIANAEKLPERRDDWLPAVPLGHVPDRAYTQTEPPVNTGMFPVTPGTMGTGSGPHHLADADTLDDAPEWVRDITSGVRRENASSASHDQAAEHQQLYQVC